MTNNDKIAFSYSIFGLPLNSLHVGDPGQRGVEGLVRDERVPRPAQERRGDRVRHQELGQRPVQHHVLQALEQPVEEGTGKVEVTEEKYVLYKCMALKYLYINSMFLTLGKEIILSYISSDRMNIKENVHNYVNNI